MEENFFQEQGQVRLSEDERRILLILAREALIEGVKGNSLEPLDLKSLPKQLTQPGATFVTLTKNNELRGCIGSLEATRPLVEDVRLHAVAAALDDYRFPPVNELEVEHITIEISRLTLPQIVEFKDAHDLVLRIRPNVDGVILKKGIRKATFLPQVWKKVPEVEIFLEMLCRKMGSGSDCWKLPGVEVYTYQVEKFQE